MYIGISYMHIITLHWRDFAECSTHKLSSIFKLYIYVGNYVKWYYIFFFVHICCAESEPSGDILALRATFCKASLKIIN